MAVNHRRSLSSVFKTVKAKCSRDKLDKASNAVMEVPASHAQDESKATLAEVVQEYEEFKPMSPPPRLEISGEVYNGGLLRSSTFRAGLEKAVDDIDRKYGTSTTEAIQDKPGVDSHISMKPRYGNPFPFRPRGNFGPRYQVPTLVDEPLTFAPSDVGELKEMTPNASVEQGTQNDEGPRTLAIAEFSIDAIMGTELQLPGILHQVQDVPDGEPVSPPRATEALDSSSPSSKEAKLCTKRMALLSDDSNDSVAVTFGDTPSGPWHNDKEATLYTVDSHVDLRREFNDLKSFPDTVTGMSLKRIRSTPESSECHFDQLNILKRPKTGEQDDPKPVTEETVPSVSELVNKFRRMSSPLGVDERQSSAESHHAQSSKMLSKSRGIETRLNRIYNGSQDSSAQHS